MALAGRTLKSYSFTQRSRKETTQTYYDSMDTKSAVRCSTFAFYK